MVIDTSSRDQVINCIHSCKNCPLYSQITRPPMSFQGDGFIPIMLVNESPSIEEYNANTPFASYSGMLLANCLQKVGFGDVNNFFRTNVIKCHKIEYDGNFPTEAISCGNLLDLEIDYFKPKIIVAFGETGIYRFSQEYQDGIYPVKKDGSPKSFKEMGGISDKHGTIEWNSKYNCYVMYMHHPYLLVHQKQKEQLFLDACYRLKEFYDNGCHSDQLIPINYYSFYEQKFENRQKFLEETRKFLNWLSTQPEYSVDLETTGLDWKSDEILLVSFSWAPGYSATVMWDLELWNSFKLVLENNSNKTLQNGKFDLHFFHEVQIFPKNFDFDTMIAAHLIDENSSVGLGSLTTRYLGLSGDYKVRFWGDQKDKRITLNSIEEIEKACTYANTDTDYTLRLKRVLEPKLKELGLWNLFNSISIPLLHVLLEIEKNGIRVHTEYQNILEDILIKEADRVFGEAEQLLYDHLYQNQKESLYKMFNWYLVLVNKLIEIIRSSGITDFTPSYKKAIEDIKKYDKEFQNAINWLLNQNINKEDFKNHLKEINKFLLNVEKIEQSIDVMDGKKKTKTQRGGLIVAAATIKTTFKRKEKDIQPIEELLEEFYNLFENFDNLAGVKMNLTSPKQMVKILYEIFNLSPYKWTDKGEPSTDKESMELLAKVHPFPKLIMDHRHINHDISNYIIGVREVFAAGNRVHPDFSQTNTVTGRLACSKPALHNISRDFRIRNMFVPRPGCLFIEADLSQAEVRLLAALSGDENLIALFREGGDVHTQNAKKIFGIPADKKPTKEQRAQAKRVVFGLIYGLHVTTLAEDLKISVDEAQALFDMFYDAYPKVKIWMDRVKSEARQTLQVTNFYGRIRRIPTIISNNRWEVQQAERFLINAPIQSSATADYSGKVYINIQKMLDEEGYTEKGVRFVHNHHDAILLEVPISLIKELKPKVQWIGENTDSTLGVPIVFDADVVRCWSGCPMTDSDIEEYQIAEILNMLPQYGNCQHKDEIKDDNDNVIGYKDICNQMFLPFGWKNDKCLDHWKTN